jgi:hypothetical protein
MELKIYKPGMLLLMALLAINSTGFAQDIAVSITTQPVVVSVKTNKDFQVKMDDFGANLKADLKDLGKNLSLSLNEIAPKINAELNELGKDINIDINPKISFSDSADSLGIDNSDNNESLETGQPKDKFKNYSKSYPVDGNDRIKLSNQYGKIVINTWDKHEIKVDVEIKAEANNDEDAQKLLNGVQITDSKNGDLISFKTDIDRSSNGSWKLWNFGGNKMHKLTINYTVYMPAKTDLGVEQSYGNIILPDLSGKVRISSSYGNVSAQNLSNPANEIGGSYGNLKVGVLNGGHLDYSYGNVDMDECNNLKADLSYGSFKLGALKGSAEFDLSYVGGFKIDEIANSFKKLNINSSYSGVALGVPSGNSFDFDITTTYGGFNYNDDKVSITSKTPSDSKHVSTTKNYKGHFGKGGSEAMINIHTSYGGVNFE